MHEIDASRPSLVGETGHSILGPKRRSDEAAEESETERHPKHGHSPWFGLQATLRTQPLCAYAFFMCMQTKRQASHSSERGTKGQSLAAFRACMAAAMGTISSAWA
jgi:hypothetical protein